jgi:hypothetical protein
MLNQILEALMTALVALLLVLIPIFGTHLTNFIVTKFKGQKYANAMNFARNAWGIVEEYFRTNSGTVATIEGKINLFETELLKVLPYATKDEIDHLRQAVAGEMNKGKAVILAPSVAEPIITVVSIAPIVKYVAPDGTELQPIVSEVAQA